MAKRRVTVINLEQYIDNRGVLVTGSVGRHIPFDVQRVFWIYGNKYPRGGHAHKECEQVLIPIMGVIDVEIMGARFMLSSPVHGLYVPPNHKVEMRFSKGAILLVLASMEYDPDDYIL